MPLKSVRTAAVVGVSVLAAGGVTAARGAGTTSTTSTTHTAFTLQRSAASATAGCLVGAGAKVKVVHRGQVEEMTIDAAGLPKNTDFDVFITQLPNAPFGISGTRAICRPTPRAPLTPSSSAGSRSRRLP